MFKGTLVASVVALGYLGISSPISFAHCQSFEFARITGGGYVTNGTGGRNTFGFNVTPDTTNGTLTVHLEYNDHYAGTDQIQIHVDTTEPLNINAQDVELPDTTDVGIDFYAMADVRTSSGDNQEQVHVTLADYGEPGTNDVFHLEVVSGPDAGYSSGNPTIESGNIQLHKDKI